jgi:type II secretory pathway pseudopilin PulG
VIRQRGEARGTAASPGAARRRRADMDVRGERGVLLVALMVAITVMMILLTASAQPWTAVMKREREEELIFRGNQYVKALRSYAAEHGGAFPTELKELMKKGPRNHRYIRHLFGDPFDPKGEWNLLYLGPDRKSAWNPHARLPEGMLPGQDPFAAAAAGGSPTGLGGMPQQERNVRGFPGSDPGAGSPSGSSFGQSSSSGFGSPGVPGRPGGGQQGMGGFGGGPQGPGGGGAFGSGHRSGFASGNLNTPIVGVVSRSTDKAFREYLNKEYYDEWEFHVFMKDIPNVQGGAAGISAGQVNINPTGAQGTGTRILQPGESDDKGRTRLPGTKLGGN